MIFVLVCLIFDFILLALYSLRHRLILITGGIASGKSTASAMLCQTMEDLIAVRARRASPVHATSADSISRALIDSPSSSCYGAVVKRFGKKILGRDGRIDRTILGDIIFGSPAKRRQLERLLHPRVVIGLLWEIVLKAVLLRQYLILEIPLLYERMSWLRYVSKTTIVIEVREEAQLERLVSRMSRERLATPPSDLAEIQTLARQRISSQARPGERRSIADLVVENSSTLDHLKAQITHACQLILS